MITPGPSIEIVFQPQFSVGMIVPTAPNVSISTPAPVLIEVGIAPIGPRGLPGGQGAQGIQGPPVDTNSLTLDGGYF